MKLWERTEVPNVWLFRTDKWVLQSASSKWCEERCNYDVSNVALDEGLK